MPFVRVFTNLARNQLPRDFMPKFNAYLATVLSKDPSLMKWTLDTDKSMAMGCDVNGAEKPFLLVEIESIGVFKTKENCSKFVPAIFEYLLKNVNDLKEENIATKFGELQAHHVGVNSKTMG